MNKLQFLFFVTLAVLICGFSSCKKANIDEVIQTEEELEDPDSYLKWTMEGETSLITNAFAVYCSSYGVEFLMISNNAALVGDTVDITTFQEGDFMILSFNFDGYQTTMGGAVFEDPAYPGVFSAILDNQSDIVIDSIANDTVSGSMIGTFLHFDGTTIDYDVEFVADIIDASGNCY